MPKSTQIASILVTDDEQLFLDLLENTLLPLGYHLETATDGAKAINALQSHVYDLVLLDVQMPHVDGIEVLKFIKGRYPDMQVIMLTGMDDVKLAVECMQLGAYSYLTKPYSSKELIATIERALERKWLSLENKILKTELARHALSSEIVSKSKPFLEVFDIAGKVAPTNSTVLIEGASGTGKELMANYIHRNSLRKEKQFVTLDCTSIPETLIESELFGHEKGAFTDAVSTKQGLVEIANGGTLFLDEVGEINPLVQPKLLRFLQTGEFRRIGSNENLRSDVRIISATNKNLRDEAAAGRFREDLLYRLNVITVTLPPLRARKEDIPLLVEYFLKNCNRQKEPASIEPEAMEILTKYEWPGNVRELENVIERATILCSDNVIRARDLALPLGVQTVLQQGAGKEASGPTIGGSVSLNDIEKVHIYCVLKNVSWNKTLAAKILGISLKTLYTKIQKYRLSKKES